MHLFLGMTVAAVRKEQTGEVCVELASGTRIRFDRVVLTVPAPIAARLCPASPSDEQTLPRAGRVPGHRVRLRCC